ncbi:DUF4129 domain-containing protein [Paenibacillus arenilitoris]|uniref:DUF4129 domain-containing protein n=1 Tax=Paenibacillus arenilitoris TaxID=2772299 RepID=A0A927CLK1_9BACL|nr:DUF4129 domain-containing protein [Paenibacillus arenilitoris]MBD2869769.1 DUF4129 domain-containing protein [Paenibacillus arenilitoris]
MKKDAKVPLSLSSPATGVVEIFFYLPVLLAATIYFLPAGAVWTWIAALPLAYWLAAAIVEAKPGMRRIARFLLAVAIGAVHAALFISVAAGELPVIATPICGILGAIAAARGMSLKLRGWVASFSNAHMLVGIVAYVAAQPLKLFAFKRLADYNGVLLFCGIAAVILFFFIANERHLNNETVDTAKSPATAAFKRQNRLLMIIVVAAITILALFRQIQQAIEDFFRSMVQKLMAWLNKPGGQETIEQPPVNQAPPDLTGGEAPKPPPEWMVVLEQILKIAGIVVVVILVAVGLFFLFRKLYQWIKRLAAKLMERDNALRKGDAGYTDEIENLMSLTNWREQLGDRLQKLIPKRKRGESWDDMKSNAERIRFLYAHLVRSDATKGRRHEPSLTPRETANRMEARERRPSELNRFIEAYEQVRYGEKSVGDDRVSDFKRQLYKDEN